MNNRDSKETYFIKMLVDVSARSTCVRRSVGAIITDEKGRILSTGYNGPPAGFPHCTELIPCLGAQDKKGDTSRCMAVHAEQNALLQCWRLDLAHTIYVSCCPCFICAKMILNVPSIRRVIVPQDYADVDGAAILTSMYILYKYDYATTQISLVR